MSDTVQKGYLNVDGTQVHLSMPFSKVDKNKRTVSGFATLDNVDTQGDMVKAEASKKAFDRSRRNLREMHRKDSAVGRVVDFREDEYFDKKTNNLYRGMYVTARVSEGAEDTWKKVLDGTLQGFSIGGEILDATNEFSKDAGTQVRVINDYDLTELSLVDNPANPLANIERFEKNVFTINKSADGSVKSLTGMIVETEIENVFICENDTTVIVKADEKANCPECDSSMQNAGWFENGPARTEKVRNIVNSFFSLNKEAAPTSASEGGVEKMSDKKDDTTTAPESSETVPSGQEGFEVHQSDVPPEDVEETGAEEKVEKAEEVEEVVDDATKISKQMDELHQAITTSLSKSDQARERDVANLEKKIGEVSETLEKKTSELEDKLNEFGKNLEKAKGKLENLEKSFDKINSNDAFRKSADVESAEPVQKTTPLWGPGTFSGDRLFQ